MRFVVSLLSKIDKIYKVSLAIVINQFPEHGIDREVQMVKEIPIHKYTWMKLIVFLSLIGLEPP